MFTIEIKDLEIESFVKELDEKDIEEIYGGRRCPTCGGGYLFLLA